MKRLIIFMVLTISVCSFPLKNTANAVTIYCEENVEKIKVTPIYQGGGPQKSYVIEDRNAVQYIMWLFRNLTFDEYSGALTSDIGAMVYSFIDSDGKVLCEFYIDELDIGLCRMPKLQETQVYRFDFYEFGYVGKKILAIRDGEEIIENEMLLPPSSWSNELIQLAIDKNLIPKLNQIGYRTSISRLDVCEIAESFLFECVPNDSTVSYYKKFYYDLTSDDYITQMKEETLKSQMTPQEWEQYHEMSLIKQENLFEDYNGRSVVLLRTIGIIDGKNDNKIYPNDLITREEMAKILSNLWHYINPDLVIIVQESNYNDSKEISDWAKAYVDEMSTIGILKGDDNGDFAPQRHMTKEEVIVSLVRLFELKGK